VGVFAFFPLRLPDHRSVRVFRLAVAALLVAATLVFGGETVTEVSQPPPLSQRALVHTEAHYLLG
jgi:hypothetical protein